MPHRLATTFDEMIDIGATEDAIAAVLGWWCRLEKALAYYTIAHHGKKMRSAVQALRVIESDMRVTPDVIARLHELRRKRNAVAHGEIISIQMEEAKKFAFEAWDLGWIVGASVPDELAISSGASLVA